MSRPDPMKIFVSLILILIASAGECSDKFKRGMQYLELGETDKVKEITGQLSGDELSHFISLSSFYAGDYRTALIEMKKTDLSDGERMRWFYYLTKLNDMTQDFNEYETEYCRIRLKKTDLVMRTYVEDSFGEIIEKIGRVFDFIPQEKILIEVYPTKEEFSIASTLGDETVERSGAIAISKFNRLMITSPQSLPYGYRWLDTVCHEYIHFVLNRVSGGNCPLWLHEGTAKYFETVWRVNPPEYLTPGNVNLLIDAMERGTLIPFSRMHPSLVYLKNQDEVNLAFCEVSTAVDFLTKKYDLNNIMRLMQTNSCDKAFKKVLGYDTGKFESNWKKYLKTLKLDKTRGAVSDKIRWKKVDEIDEFVGMELRDYVRLGDRFRKNDNYESAYIQYQKALAIEPYNPVVLLKMAKSLLARGEGALAEEKLKLAVKNNPNYVSGYELLGEYYVHSGNYEAAVEICNQAISINPFNPAVHYYLAKAYIELNKLEEAYKELKNLELLEPYYPGLKNYLEKLEKNKE